MRVLLRLIPLGGHQHPNEKRTLGTFFPSHWPALCAVLALQEQQNRGSSYEEFMVSMARSESQAAPSRATGPSRGSMSQKHAFHVLER